MTDDLERVMSAMRAAGWRSNDERLRSTAVKRLATARWHQEQATGYRATAARMSNESPVDRRRFILAALRHEVRAAERGGAVTRAVRQLSLKLVPTWTGGDAQELLDVAQSIAGPPGAACASPHLVDASYSPAGPEAPGVRQFQLP